MSSDYELAQLNIGVLKGPMDSPLLTDFVANLDRINAIADASAGFVWRLQTEEGDATGIRAFDDDLMLVNLSVWQNLESLRKFVYRSAHAEVLRRREEWFERMAEAFLVLWWVPNGHRPGVDEAKSRLEVLRRQGSSPAAFTFRQPFPPPDTTPMR